ncbi:C40 family peptidase [Tellurirhabdus rosea]|uniref:C40 family peptidase n=1 Tax=Tellurirhabdus rosea TaxID=2674997 RepID=UPI002254A786|nr:C40 family peptidase [Tellurirhabdus rosea]
MKKVLLTAFFAVWAAFVSAKPAAFPVVSDSIGTSTRSETPSLVDELISYSRKYLHARYRSGGSSPRGFDCSGFTRFCFSQFGIRLPHSSAAQHGVGDRVDRKEARPGDLIFFKGHSQKGSRIGHVGLIVEVIGDRIKFIHSAWNGGVRYDWLHAGYYRARFAGVRRVDKLID